MNYWRNNISNYSGGNFVLSLLSGLFMYCCLCTLCSCSSNFSGQFCVFFFSRGCSCVVACVLSVIVVPPTILGSLFFFLPSGLLVCCFLCTLYTENRQETTHQQPREKRTENKLPRTIRGTNKQNVARSMGPGSSLPKTNYPRELEERTNMILGRGVAYPPELGLVDLVRLVENDPDGTLVVLEPHQNLNQEI